ncbi:MAG: DUF4065 domain-containing protein, partial [Raoultibacter sp.]
TVQIKSETESIKLEDASYFYTAEFGTCTACGHRATPDAFSEKNQQAFEAAVRRKNDHIISQKSINAIPVMYDIGKRPLSQLLGWGEHTYTRFLEGSIPSKEYSDVLHRIFQSPFWYLFTLIKNATLLSSVAYKKSLRATIRLIEQSCTRLEISAGYLLAKTGVCSPLALQKELYYAQGFSFALLPKPLFENSCQAWIHGPVFTEIWAQFDIKELDVDDSLLKELGGAFGSMLADDDKELLDAISVHVACYAPWVLRNFTHAETPWRNARKGLKENEPSRNEIRQTDMREFFSGIKEEYSMQSPKDICRYMQAMFLQEQQKCDPA